MDAPALLDVYPTRDGGRPRAVPRPDPVVWSPWRPDAGLTIEQYAAYERDGFVVVPDVFDSSEMACLRAELDRMRTEPGLLERPEAIREKRSGALRSFFAPHRHSPTFAALLRDPRLLRVAELLLGGGVYVHQARVNYKPAFRGEGFYWHSDFETWHAEDGLPRLRALSASVALSENTALNGPLVLMRRSHRLFVSCPQPTPAQHYRDSLREQVVGTPDDASLAQLAEGGIEAAIGGPGSVIFFDANTMHGSAANITPYPRSNVFFVYNSVDNQPLAPFGGTPPRPGFVAERTDFRPLEAVRFRAPSAGVT